MQQRHILILQIFNVRFCFSFSYNLFVIVACKGKLKVFGYGTFFQTEQLDKVGYSFSYKPEIVTDKTDGQQIINLHISALPYERLASALIVVGDPCNLCVII